MCRGRGYLLLNFVVNLKLLQKKSYIKQKNQNKQTETSRVKIILNCERLNTFSPKRYLLFPLLLNIELEVLASTIRQRKRNQNNTDWKLNKFSLFTDNMIISTENFTDSIKNLQNTNDGVMMANFMCQLDSAKRCPDTW